MHTLLQLGVVADLQHSFMQGQSCNGVELLKAIWVPKQHHQLAAVHAAAPWAPSCVAQAVHVTCEAESSE
jgi:hypothetical protein